MKSYIITTLELEPEVTALHCGNKGLRRTLISKVIASEIVALGTSGQDRQDCRNDISYHCS